VQYLAAGPAGDLGTLSSKMPDNMRGSKSPLHHFVICVFRSQSMTLCVWRSFNVVPSTDDFTAKVITALERLTRPPQLIRGFFGVPNLRHITS
jgi:hypothetical protein